MKKLAVVLGMSVWVMGLAACGNSNESACKDYVKKVTACGGIYAQTYNDSWCSGFKDTSCDVSAYFNCLSDGLGSCTNGNFSSADAAKLSACASKATCQ